MNKLKLPAAASLALLLVTSCADMFQDRVAMQTGTNNANLASLLISPEEITKLSAPAQIFASRDMYSDRILISWTPVEHATSYRLERAEATERDLLGNYIVPDEGEFDTLEHTTNLYATNYEDVVIDQYSLNYRSEEYDKAYFYRVCAENPRMKYDSSDFTVSSYATLLSPVKKISASMGESTEYIKISWERVNGASRYEIRRTEMEGGGTQHIDYVNGTQLWYRNTIPQAYQGKDFYFTVTAISSYGTTSVESAQAYGYTLQEGAPQRVTGVKINKGRGDIASGPIEISWTGAGDSKYVVYRSSSKDATLEKLKDGVSGTSYSDSKNLKENTYYYYYVQSVKGGTSEADPIVKGPMSESGPDNPSPCEGFLLSAPVQISVQKITGSTKCMMTISAALGSEDCPEDSKKSSSYNNYVYNIYGAENQNDAFAGEPFTVYTPANAVNGMYSFEVDGHKFYKVATVNAANNVVSAKSSVVAPAPFAVKNSASTCGEFIEGITSRESDANDNGVFPVKISWDEPDEGADGGYNVYRSTSRDSGFRKINDSPVTGTTYIDKFENAKVSTMYYYRVLSLNVLGEGVNYSPSTKGYGALTAEQYMREYCKTTMSSQKKLTLMHKAGNTAKLGSESAHGKISGSLSYNAKIDGVSGRVIMHYDNYADFYIDEKNKDLGVTFNLTGNTNTSAGIDTNGTMDGTVICTGMYPGSVGYDNIKIKGGAAGGGTYLIKRDGFAPVSVDWTVGEK